MANVAAIIANRGFYYTPHVVKAIGDEKMLPEVYKKKHFTMINASYFDSVIAGMARVCKPGGTAPRTSIEGIVICAKTGTAENFRILDGRRVQLKDNSVFVCFAPRENPKIAIAVIVENAGFGSTWAGPIAALMMEKYLNDTLRPERVKEVERIAAANLMPAWLEREQYKADSARAAYWANLTKDSTNYLKYLKKGSSPKKDSVPKLPVKTAMQREAILNNEKNNNKPVRV